MNQHPTVRELLAERLKSTGHRILGKDPTGEFLEAVFTIIHPELRPFTENFDAESDARTTLAATIASLQTMHYEAQSTLNAPRAVKIGKILDAALVCLDHLIEVKDERRGNDEGAG
jgi:hypothetical protein